VTLSFNEQLAKMIVQLMLKKEKPDKEKLREKLSHIHPASRASFIAFLSGQETGKAYVP